MPVDVRPLDDADRGAAYDLRQQAFSAEHRPFDAERDRLDREEYAPLGRRLGAYDGGRLVGHLAAWEFAQHMGGVALPMAGIGGVCVAPEWRGAGAADGLLHRALADAHERGEPLSTLFAANLPLYRGRGWQSAGVHVVRTVETDALVQLPRPSSPVSLRPAGPADVATMEALHADVLAGAPGTLRRSAEYSRHALLGVAGRTATLALRDGRPVGYLTWEKLATEDGFDLSVPELMALDRDALLALWRSLADWYPTVRRVRFGSRPVEPLQLLLRGGRPEMALAEEVWMLRLVDVAAALECRGYPPLLTGALDLRVHDAAAPWNDRTLHVEVEAGRGSTSPGSAVDAVELDVGTLAAISTGWLDPREAARCGLLDARPEQLDLLGAGFAGPTPWSQSYF